MFKIGERVCWRNPSDLSDSRIGIIKEINLSLSLPYTISCCNRPYKGAEVKATGVSLTSTDRLVAKAVVLSKSPSYFNFCNDFAASRLQDSPGAIYRSADLVVFCGGEDVAPWMYNEPRHEKTVYISPKRDSQEAMIYREAKRLGIPCVGICRGAQFLNVMNGGKLIQHVTNHTSEHDVTTSCGHSFRVSSTHHQMMSPADNAELLAWAEGVSSSYEGLESFRPEMINNKAVEPEVVLYKDTQDLCVQFHPEIMQEGSPARRYFREILKEIL